MLAERIIAAAATTQRIDTRETTSCSFRTASCAVSYQTNCIASRELAEIGVQRIALACKHDARERAGKDEMAWFKRHAVLAEFVGKPRHAERRMAEHTGSNAGLFNFRCGT